MDNKKPYNEFDEQFNDLPLPGEEQSWQKMKQMLDEDDRGRKPLVPIFLKSCAGWGLALLLSGTAAWFILKPQTWWQPKDAVVQTDKRTNHTSLHPGETNSAVPVEKNNSDPNRSGVVTPVETAQDRGNSTAGNTGSGSTGTTATTNLSQVPGAQNSTTGNTKNGKVPAKTKGNPTGIVVYAGKSNSQLPDGTKKNNKTSKGKGTPVKKDLIKPAGAVIATKPGSTGDHPVTDGSLTKTEKTQQSDTLLNKTSTQATDSASIKQTTPADTAAVVQKKHNKSKSTKLVISAGIGLQQQIPIGGQQAVPYDYYGRTGSLSDYIPSVYLRAGKVNKWFVQGEFRYGAPQTLKDFQYSRQTKVDSQSMTVTTYRLKKTYYHQLPFSFNYYVLPNLTIGIGGIYNRFYGAVTEKEVKTTDLQTQVETLSREIVNIQHFNDSFLYKTQVHALVQTEYHWKRFDFGLRYTKDIQPYIKYTQPDGKIDVKKNQTFQLLVRYRIWQSGK